MSSQPSTPLTIAADVLAESARPIIVEVNTYLRELPRLVADGNEGRYALILGPDLFGVWDTFGDAVEAGYERFGPDGRFVAQKIDGRDLDRLRALAEQNAQRVA